jgi:hypothetical protein
MYVTNNSRSHRDEYRARLAEMGLPLDEDSIVTAARATALLLAERHPRPRRRWSSAGRAWRASCAMPACARGRADRATGWPLSPTCWSWASTSSSPTSA